MTTFGSTFLDRKQLCVRNLQENTQLDWKKRPYTIEGVKHHVRRVHLSWCASEQSRFGAREMRLGVGVAFTGMQAGPVLAGGPYPSRPPDESLRSLSVPVRGPSCATLVCHPNLSRKLDFHCGTYGKEAAGFKFLHYVPVECPSNPRVVATEQVPARRAGAMRPLPSRVAYCHPSLPLWAGGRGSLVSTAGVRAVAVCISPSPVQPRPFRTRPVVLIGPWCVRSSPHRAPRIAWSESD